MARARAIIERAVSVRPRSASSTPWQRTDVASTAGEADVMRSSRTTSRQRPPARVTGPGPHRAATGATPSTAMTRPAVVHRPGRAEGAVELGLALGDAAEAGQHPGQHEVGLGLAGPVVERGQRGGRVAGDPLGLPQPVGVGQRGALGGEARRPGLEAAVPVGQGGQLVQHGRRLDHRPRGEEGLGGQHGQLGAPGRRRRVGGGERPGAPAPRRR